MKDQILLSKYNNGNYTVEIYNDGTKIRETKEEDFIASFPENIDIKITNYCENNCKFCFESSSIEGKHADLDADFIKTLKPYTELAIGGGNPLSHPQLFEFLKVLKEYKIIANITVRQNDFMDNIELLKKYSDNKLLYGIGVSLVTPTKEFISKIQEFPNAVIHTIAGLLTKENLAKLILKNIKILILGYKVKGKGQTYMDEFNAEIASNIQFLAKDILKYVPLFKVVSFDNLSIKQLNLQEQIKPELWNEFYMGDDGKFTMYIDLVKKKFSKNSINDQVFDLKSDIVEMFNIVTKLP